MHKMTRYANNWGACPLDSSSYAYVSKMRKLQDGVRKIGLHSRVMEVCFYPNCEDMRKFS